MYRFVHVGEQAGDSTRVQRSNVILCSLIYYLVIYSLSYISLRLLFKTLISNSQFFVMHSQVLYRVCRARGSREMSVEWQDCSTILSDSRNVLRFLTFLMEEVYIISHFMYYTKRRTCLAFNWTELGERGTLRPSFNTPFYKILWVLGLGI